MEDGSHEVDYPERGRYEGEFKDGKPHGQGIMKYANGDVYDGRWAADEKWGQGTMKYANGDVYDGYWMYDLRNFYEGEWEYHGGKRSDRSIMKYANGDVYDGEWDSDCKSRNGTMKYANGDVYDGEWDSDCKSRNGTMKYANGDVYVGQWKWDKKNGYGQTSYANGENYNGKYEDGDELDCCTNCSTYGRFYENGEWCTICKDLICPMCARTKSEPIECDSCEEEIDNHMSEEYGDDLDAEDETIGHRQGGYDPYKND